MERKRWERALDCIFDLRADLLERIFSFPASTVEELAAKARIAKQERGLERNGIEALIADLDRLAGPSGNPPRVL